MAVIENCFWRWFVSGLADEFRDVELGQNIFMKSYLRPGDFDCEIIPGDAEMSSWEARRLVTVMERDDSGL